MDNTEELFGFENLGNICFMSCFIQLLLSSKIMRETLKTIRFDIDPITSIVTPNLGILFEDPSSNRLEISKIMMKYLEYLTRVRRIEHYSKGVQYDLGEYSTIFFDVLSKYFEDILFEDKSFRNIMNSYGDIGYSEKPGVLKLLQIPLRKDFYQSMSEFCIYDVVGESEEDVIYFSKVFTHIPKVLFIQLARFNALGEKDGTKMQMYERIYMIENEIQVPYRLRSIGIHFGGVGGGHYIAQRRVGNEWYELDDESVKKTRNPNLTTGYFYVYEREGCEIVDEDLIFSKIIPEIKEKQEYPGRLSRIEELCREKNIVELEIMYKRYDFIQRIIYCDEDRIVEFLELFVSTQDSVTDLLFVEIMQRITETKQMSIFSRIRSNFLERFQEDTLTLGRLNKEAKHFRRSKREDETDYEFYGNEFENIEYYYSLMYNCIISKQL